MKRFILALGLVLFVGYLCKAQKENASSFNALTATYRFHPDFFFYGEAQIRGIADYSYPDYYELKGGIGYFLTKDHMPFVGFGRYVNYKDHYLNKEEFRIWLQDIINFREGSVKFENRFRAEQSWFYEPKKDQHSSRTRLRYRLNISVPLNNKKVEPGTVFVNVYDEIFFVFPMKPTFARHRLYGGFGYQIDKTFGIASGHLWQREFSSNGNTNLYFVYLALNINLDNTKSDRRTYTFPGAD